MLIIAAGLPLYAAVEKGYFKEAGLDVEAIKFAGAQQVAPGDARISAGVVEFDSPRGYGKGRAYLVRPANAAGPRPVVLVVHENRGLNPHIEDITRRLALDNFIAVAPDALFPLGIKVFAGAKAIEQAVTMDSIDVVLTAMVGYAGLRPTLAAINAQKPIALATLFLLAGVNIWSANAAGAISAATTALKLSPGSMPWAVANASPSTISRCA